MPQSVTTDTSIKGFSEDRPRVSEFKRIVRVFMKRKIALFGLVIIVAFLLTAIFAAQIAPYDPYKNKLSDSLLQPSSEHLLGTDSLGRDILSRIIFGTRTALLVGVVSLFIASALGVCLGLIAGFFGGWCYMIIMRFIDSLMSFPMILLALVLAALLGGGLRNVTIAIGISLMSVYARLMCGQVLTIKQNDYITASKSIGASNLRIMFRHLFPNCFPPLIVLVTMQMGSAILAEAGLSFLGVGIAPPGTAWGAMVSNGYNFLLTHPWISIAPGVAIMLVVFSFNMVGDGLRDALDPRLRGLL
ncbi:MAG: ABC transporter permease [Dehalococcoidales bacterium]|nr:ABC transporter permease [Dehalococcoidales bacterium]